MRIEPPPSLACAIGTRPAETAAAAPPLDPPGVSSVFHGFRVAPFRSDSVNATVPNSGVFVFPTTTKPALPDAADDGRVEVRDVLRVRSGRVGRPDAGRRRQVLDPDRNAAKGRVSRRRVDARRCGECLVPADGDERVERGVEPVDLLERELDELGRRDFAAAYEPRLLDGEAGTRAPSRRTYSKVARAGLRTGDTTVFSRVLYQLSYLAKAAQCSRASR